MTGLAAAAPGPMLPAGTFAGATVLVTGGGTGLGKAIAVEFGRAGAAVAVASRNEEHRAAGVAAVEAVGARAVGVELDVRQPESIATAFERAATLGPVTMLINNAAANFPVPAADLSPNGWRAVEQIVLDGTFFCSQELYRRVTASGGTGAIVNIVSTAAATGGPGMAHSAAAKAGVANLTKTLAVEWAPDGVRVNAIAPGLFPHDDLPAALQAARDHAVDNARQPAGRVGQPHELGWAATYLCSPYAAFITGHVLVVDGGNWLRRDFAMPPFTPIKQQLGDRSR